MTEEANTQFQQFLYNATFYSQKESFVFDTLRNSKITIVRIKPELQVDQIVNTINWLIATTIFPLVTVVTPYRSYRTSNLN